MCRLLFVQSNHPFSPVPHLEAFAHIARNSKEYQGHGWGYGYINGNGWHRYRSITPIWEDRIAVSGKTTLLIAHARSAFRDEGIVVENNMPFFDGTYMFVFNGELRGVRIRERGRTGAEKIFHFIKRFDTGSVSESMRTALSIIQKRTRYIRAMNMIMASANKASVATFFNEDPLYFTLHRKKIPGGIIIASEPYPGETDWEPIPNQTIEEITW